MRLLLVVCLLIGSITCVPIAQGPSDPKPQSSPGLPWDSGRVESSGLGSSSFPLSPSSVNAPHPAPLDASYSSGPVYSGPGASSSAGAYSGPGASSSAGAYSGPGASHSAGPVYSGPGASSSAVPVYSSPGASYSAGPAYSSPSMAGGSTGGHAGFGAVYANPEAGYGAPSTGYGSSAPGSSYGGGLAGGHEGVGSHGFVSAPGYESWSSGSAAGYDAGSEEPQQVFSDVSELEPVYAFSSRSSYQRGRAVFGQTRYTPGEPVVPPMPIYRPIIKIPVQPSAPVKQSPPVKAPTKGGY
ncbi:spidroin-2-like isoform X2 [Cheilinus undulatus]|uniref:spidroin-2-like isoform X1 n=1 Tax=Cheilinus undulatus TaxID=241271 RepID=UPI001BD397FB|nr:spidroin-2-like isoform X1 [Cheilinus undulatus]XP_041651287.1 spidroin-2-like isoform X2 [Cheilinus undulatus]